MLDDKKALILEAAKRLFLSKGISAVSMDMVAKEVPCSKVTIYKYFDDKRHLVQAVVEMTVENERQSLAAAIESSMNSLDAIKAMFAHRSVQYSIYSGQFVEDLVNIYPELAGFMLKQNRDEVLPMFESTFAQAQADGYVKATFSPRLIVLFMQAAKEFLIRPDVYKDYATEDDAGKQVLSIFLDGILV